MSAPRILIVDDQRDISRMLRAALETLGRGYVIVDVPSAEEAQLEFRRGPVDLLITDLRLPGISGLELIRRLHKASSEARLIVISGYADETAQAEFRNLGAMFFPKPLDLQAFLKGVQAAVGAREEARGREPAAGGEGATPAASQLDGGQPDIAGRLARLRRDLGALVAFLVDVEGHIAVQAGETTNLDLNILLPRLMEAWRASLKVSQALGGQAPANVHFFDGSAYDLYSANVGEYFSLVILFDGQRGTGQLGPVLRYGRHASDDLLNALRKMGVKGGKFPAGPDATAVLDKPGRRVKTAPLRKKTGPLPPIPPKAETTPATPPARQEPVAPETLRALDTAAEKTTKQDAAKFWEGVDGAELGDARSGTLTWEEAAKRGLVPPKTPEK